MSQKRSMFHAVSQPHDPGACGSGSSVRSSAGVGSVVLLSAIWSVGVAVRPSAAANPDATPITASSVTMSAQKVRPLPGRSVSDRMARRRCTAPRTPIATIAPTFTSTRTPYGVARFENAPTRICADATPDTATSTKHPSAMLE